MSDGFLLFGLILSFATSGFFTAISRGGIGLFSFYLVCFWTGTLVTYWIKS